MSKKILVTGVGGPMGRATVEILVNSGYFVIGITSGNLDIDPKAHKIFRCDFSDEEQIYEVVELIRNMYKDLDGIVNLSGVFIEMNSFKADAVDNFKSSFNINFWPALILTSKLSDCISPNGSIVNISSTDAYYGGISGAGYAASKAALNSLTMSLANILSPRRIRSNAIAIGWAGSGMGAPGDVIKMIEKDNLLGRVGKYEEVAELVEFLLSDKSSYINGSIINFDGGDTSSNSFLAEEARLLGGSE